MKRIYDVVEEASCSWKDQLIKDVADISKIDLNMYDLLCELGFTNSKTYKDLLTEKKMNKKVSLKRTLELCDRYAERYPYDAFIQKSELDKICKNQNYIFGSVSMYRGEVKDCLIKHSFHKRDMLDDDDAIFYLEDSTSNKAGFFSQEEIDDNGYTDDNRYTIERAELKILAPIGLMETQKWNAHPEPKSTGCAAFLHVVRGYLQICSF